MGRPIGVKWARVHRQTVRLYDATREDVAELRAFVKFLQTKIYKRKIDSSEN